MKTKNTILKAIDYLSIYATKSEKFNDFKFIGTSIDNPLKVSYIKQDKIDSLLDYTGKKIKGTKEQRKKYFTSTSINKMLSAMFIDEREKTETISADIDKQLRKNYCKNVELFIEDDLIGFYSQENKNYIYNPNGSCMSKKPASYFEIYDKFINTKAQIVGLKVGKSVVARAILWTKTKNENIIDGVQQLNHSLRYKEQKFYFLDRIYIANEFQNSNKAELQTKLYNRIKRALKLKRLDCFSITHIKDTLKKYSDLFNKDFKESKSYPNFTIQININTFHSLENYPYMDSFRWGGELRENIKFDADEDSHDYILDSTAGDYTEGNSEICDCCGERYNEDEIRWSEVEDCMICDDCGVYVEEREDIVRQDNATYNTLTGLYHYTPDLQ